MRRAKPDIVSLVAGGMLLALGILLLLDANGTLDLRFAALAPIGCAVLGAILLAAGLSRQR